MSEEVDPNHLAALMELERSLRLFLRTTKGRATQVFGPHMKGLQVAHAEYVEEATRNGWPPYD